jgi:hypothetical protein
VIGRSACVFYGRTGPAYNWPPASIFYATTGPDSRTDGRTDRRTGFLQERGEVGPSPSSGFLLCAWVPLVPCLSVRLSDDVLGAFSMAEPAREITDHRLPATQVLRARSWEPNAATRQQQKKGAASVCLSPETQLSRVLIGLALWLLKLGFLGRYQYIKDLLKKRRRGY